MKYLLIVIAKLATTTTSYRRSVSDIRATRKEGNELTIVLIMCVFLPLTVKQDHQPGTSIASTIQEHTDPNSEAHEAGMRLALAASKCGVVRTYSWIGAAMRPWTRKL